MRKQENKGGVGRKSRFGGHGECGLGTLPLREHWGNLKRRLHWPLGLYVRPERQGWAGGLFRLQTSVGIQSPRNAHLLDQAF